MNTEDILCMALCVSCVSSCPVPEEEHQATGDEYRRELERRVALLEHVVNGPLPSSSMAYAPPSSSPPPPSTGAMLMHMYASGGQTKAE
jgi:hypothetical protein